MFGFGKKRAPLLSLLIPLEKLYKKIEEETQNTLDESDLSIADLENVNPFNAYLEPKAFSYVLLIWGIQLSKLNGSEKQILSARFTNMLGKKISKVDGGDFLRSRLQQYNAETDKCKDRNNVTKEIALTLIENIGADPTKHLIAFIGIASKVSNSINMVSDFIDNILKEFKFEY